MTKKSHRRDEHERAERRLAKVQLELHHAQGRRSQAVLRGEREIAETQQRATRRLTKATKNVERRIEAVERAQAHLAGLTSEFDQVQRVSAPREIYLDVTARFHDQAEFELIEHVEVIGSEDGHGDSAEPLLTDHSDSGVLGIHPS